MLDLKEEYYKQLFPSASNVSIYTQYKDQEFFTSSKETLSAFLEIKHEILEKYNID